MAKLGGPPFHRGETPCALAVEKAWHICYWQPSWWDMYNEYDIPLTISFSWVLSLLVGWLKCLQKQTTKIDSVPLRSNFISNNCVYQCKLSYIYIPYTLPAFPTWILSPLHFSSLRKTGQLVVSALARVNSSLVLSTRNWDFSGSMGPKRL